MNIYVQCFLIGLIGLAIQVWRFLKDKLDLAASTNVEFNWRLYWRIDFWMQFAGSFLVVLLGLMLIKPTFQQFPKVENDTLFIMLVFATCGYFGSSMAISAFSVVRGRMYAAAGDKALRSDEATGNLDKPTVAAKPETKQQP